MVKDSSKIEALADELAKLEKHPLKQGDGYIICSDESRVSYRAVSKNVSKKIEHLPEEERLSILEKSNAYQKINGRMLSIRNQLSKNPAYRLGQWGITKKDRRDDILALYGKMHSSEEIHKIMVNDWQLKKITLSQLVKFEIDHKDSIGELKEKYQKDINSVRLSHKRSRLDEIQSLYLEFKQRQEDNGLSKNSSEMMLKLLEQARKEVEGQQIHINGQIKVEHEIAIQDHVNTEIMKSLNINDIIIGRLCSRLQINPKYILYRLHTSYYKKFTGFLPDQMDDKNEVEYPSQIVYDFNRITELNKNLDVQDVSYTEETEVIDIAATKSLKDKLKAKLKEKRDKSKKDAK
jgi:hypothetical protein